MAWTNPHTFVAGELLTAATLNTYLRDNTSFLYSNTLSGFFFSRSSSPPTAGQTKYYGIWESVNETDVSIPMPTAGRVAILTVAVDISPGAAQTFVYTMRKNAADQVVTCTISGAAAKAAADRSHAFAFAADDLVSCKAVVSAGGATAQHRIVWQANNN